MSDCGRQSSIYLLSGQRNPVYIARCAASYLIISYIMRRAYFVCSPSRFLSMYMVICDGSVESKKKEEEKKKKGGDEIAINVM